MPLPADFNAGTVMGYNDLAVLANKSTSKFAFPIQKSIGIVSTLLSSFTAADTLPFIARRASRKNFSVMCVLWQPGQTRLEVCRRCNYIFNNLFLILIGLIQSLYFSGKIIQKVEQQQLKIPSTSL